jgi:hypothetical protein
MNNSVHRVVPRLRRVVLGTTSGYQIYFSLALASAAPRRNLLPVRNFGAQVLGAQLGLPPGASG